MINLHIKDHSVFEYVEKIKALDGQVLGYVLLEDVTYYSPRYGKRVTGEKGWRFDGATKAPDIDSFGWLIHDIVKAQKKFSDGTECSNWQASHILSDILKYEGRWFRSRSWFLSTLIWGEIMG